MSTRKRKRKRRPSNVTYGEHDCDECGETFTRKKKWQRFCGTRCRWDWHNARKSPYFGEDREVVDEPDEETRTKALARATTE